MALIDELKEKRLTKLEEIEEINAMLKGAELELVDHRLDLDDLDRAIAALEPAPVAEPETQTEPGWIVTEIHPSPDAYDKLAAYAQAQFAERVANKAMSGLGFTDEPDVASDFAEPDDKAQRSAAIELTADVEPLPEATPLERIPEWNEPQTEGYAPVTNPEADFWARGLERDQKPQTYNPFNIFRREKEEA
jgi:hypothetical protein